MMTLFIALWLLVSPFAQDESKALQFDVRARQNLLLGKGEQSGREYYDVADGDPTAHHHKSFRPLPIWTMGVRECVGR